MIINLNHKYHVRELKQARQRTPLTLDDVRVLLHQRSWGPLSKIEAGKRSLTLDVLVGYHVLFGVPVETLLVREIGQFRNTLESRVEARIEEIASKSNSVDLAERIYYLQKFTKYEQN